MKFRSRTIITRVIVFLLLGAIVNVAVAWGCAIWVNSMKAGELRTIDQQQPFEAYRREQPFPIDYQPTLMIYSEENPGPEDLHEFRFCGLTMCRVGGEINRQSGG